MSFTTNFGAPGIRRYSCRSIAPHLYFRASLKFNIKLDTESKKKIIGDKRLIIPPPPIFSEN